MNELQNEWEEDLCEHWDSVPKVDKKGTRVFLEPGLSINLDGKRSVFWQVIDLDLPSLRESDSIRESRNDLSLQPSCQIVKLFAGSCFRDAAHQMEGPFDSDDLHEPIIERNMFVESLFSIIRSFDHSIIRSFDHSIVRSFDHSFDPLVVRCLID